MLFASELDLHEFAQIEGAYHFLAHGLTCMTEGRNRLTNEQAVQAVDLGNLFYIFDTLDTLNLDNDEKVLVGSGNVVSVGSLKSVGGEHRTETPGSGGRVLGPADYPLGVLLISCQRAPGRLELRD